MQAGWVGQVSGGSACAVPRPAQRGRVFGWLTAGLLTPLPGTIACSPRLAVGASTPSHRGHFVLGEREVCDLEKEPGSRRQVCWK